MATTSNIVNSLGFGSGLNVTQIVSDLAAASRDPKVEKLDARAAAAKASISAVGQVRSDLETFSASLDQVIAGGTLSAPLALSDAKVLDAATVKGSAGLGIDATVTVNRLAQAQNSMSARYTSRTDNLGTGSFTLTVNGVATNIPITTGNDTLDGIASAINDAGKGVTARVVNDGTGFRLVLRGATGAAGNFSLSSSDPGLTDLAAGITNTQAAQNAEVVVDGVTYTRPTNKLEDVVYGVVLNIKDLGTTRLVAQSNKDTYSTALQDFVAAYNTLKTDLTAALTATKGDPGLRSLSNQLASLVSKTVSSGAYGSLGSIGVQTLKDGTLQFNAATFEAAYAANAEAVVAVFVPKRDGTHTSVTDPGIGGALAAVKTSALATYGALTNTTTKLTRQQKAVEDDRTTMEAREAAYKARLEKQFGGLDAKVGAYKATQSYLKQQIDLWTKSS